MVIVLLDRKISEYSVIKGVSHAKWHWSTEEEEEEKVKQKTKSRAGSMIRKKDRQRIGGIKEHIANQEFCVKQHTE